MNVFFAVYLVFIRILLGFRMEEPGPLNVESVSLPATSSPTSDEAPSLQQNGTSTSLVLNSDSPKDSPSASSPLTEDKPAIPQNPEDLARLKRQ